MKKLLFIFLLFSNAAFAGNILTTTGLKPVEKITVGDSVIGRSGINVVKATRFFDTANCWYLINGEYKFFCHQSIILASGPYSVCHIEELQIGWGVLKNREPITIKSIKKIDGAGWYKLDISGDHTYIEDGILVHNAARFWNKQNASANWNATAPTNWGSSSGTADGASVPGSSDDVTLDGAGAGGNANGTVSASLTILSLTFTTGYTATVTQNASQNITIAGNFTDQTQHSWTINSGAQLVISAASTITSNSKTYPGGVTFSGTNTKTLSGDWTISGTLTISGATTLNSGTLISAGVNTTTSGIATASTGTLQLSGGTWQGGNTVGCNLTIAGNVTVSGSVNFSTGTLLYSSGSVTTTSSTLTLNNTSTLNTNGISWNNVSLAQTSTITINSLLTATGTLSCPANVAITWAGTTGWTVGTYTVSATQAATQTFANTVTYTITTAFNAFTSRTGSIVLFASDHATNKANLTLQNGATCNVLASFTRIDASAGRTIWTFNGTVTSCININSFSELKTVSKSFVQ